MIDKILEKLKNEKKLCFIQRDYENGEDYGFIIGFNESIVFIKKYDRDGLYDGYKVINKNDIEEIKYSGNKIDAITKFINEEALFSFNNLLNYSSFESFLETANKEFGYVSVNNDEEDKCLIGKILEQDENYIHMINYGNPSQRDKSNYLIAKSTVQSLDVDGIYDRNLMKLHNEIV